ncbi:hypothetical protein F2Q68_00013562 [Brassica cretica]|uniref:Uncharacterized protein n=1 Tax=Brassica cretica TaxID=69181 RepID=A0A8S9HP84_BRACR|nr:hypothetical protein F2Q68_00013562 [Brassica cretica]
MFFSRSVLAITMKVFHLRPMCFVNIISDEFYAAWKDRILLLGSVSVESEGSSESASSSRLCGCLKGDGDGDSKVSLLRVGSFQRERCDSVFKFSYVQRMMSCLWGMEEGERDELDVIFDEFGNAFVDLIELLETGRNVYGLIYLKKLAVHLELPTARGSLVSLR